MSIKQITEIGIPWRAWHGDTVHQLLIPNSINVDVLSPRDAPALTAEQIATALDNPLKSNRLQDLARNRRTACIAVDDLARPTRAAEILPPVIERLEHAGLSPGNVTVVMATGTHGRPTDEQARAKVGDWTAQRCRVEVHDCRRRVAGCGIRYGEAELMINETFLRADLKIGIGCVMPHSFAGYSGGAKIVLPGLADIAATERGHKFVQMGLRRGARVNDNKFRTEIEQHARTIGLEFIINVVPNSRRETAALFAGDLVVAHRAACAQAGHNFSTCVEHTYDCLLLNAYPKDIDLIQAHNALVALKTAARPVVRDGGLIIIASAASEGLGRHGLFEPTGASYRAPSRLRALGDLTVWIYAPTVASDIVAQTFWGEYPTFHSPQALSMAIEKQLKEESRMGIAPCAPMQRFVGRDQ